jgi:hypothetical protein
MANSTLKCRCGCKGYGRREAMLVMPNKAAFLDEAHAAAYALRKRSRDTARAEADAAKADRKRMKQRRAALNETNLKWQKHRTKVVVHELVKLLDARAPCIVCSEFNCGNSSEWDAGHFLTKAAHPELAFDLRNIFKQCSPTNTASSRPAQTEASIRQKFEANIAARFGMPLLHWLKSYHPPRKWTCQELAAWRAECAAEVSRLKRGEPPSRDWRSIEAKL